MKTLKSMRLLACLFALSLVLVSCANNNDDSPFQSAAVIGGGYTGSGNPVPTNTTDLLNQLKQRVRTDLAYLQSGGRLACEYNCPESTAANCVRIFSHANGEIKFETYRRNFEIWQNGRDINDIIGARMDEAHMSGVITEAMFDPYFSNTSGNFQIQQQQIQFPDMGLILILWTPTPFGVWPFSIDIPAGANFLPNKQWCTAQQ